MKKNTLFLFVVMLAWFMGCASLDDRVKVNEVNIQEKIEKDFKDGKMSYEKFVSKMLEAKEQDLDRDYSKGQLNEIEYKRQKATISIKAVYHSLAYTTTEDHLKKSLIIAKQSPLPIDDLILYRYDGVVTMSNKKEQMGMDIGAIDNHVKLDSDGLLAKDRNDTIKKKGEKGRIGMVSPLHNHKACYKCHSKEKKVLGGLYIMFNAAELMER